MDIELDSGCVTLTHLEGEGEVAGVLGGERVVPVTASLKLHLA